jgi:integrase
MAYTTLCRRSELVTLRIDDVAAATHADRWRFSILLRKSKADQEARVRWLPLRDKTMFVIEQWIKATKLCKGPILRSIDLGENIGSTLNSGQTNRNYMRLARRAGLDPDLIANISGRALGWGAAQDLLASVARIATMMQRDEWSKSDTVMG